MFCLHRFSNRSKEGLLEEKEGSRGGEFVVHLLTPAREGLQAQEGKKPPHFTGKRPEVLAGAWGRSQEVASSIGAEVL